MYVAMPSAMWHLATGDTLCLPCIISKKQALQVVELCKDTMFEVPCGHSKHQHHA